MSSSAQRWRDTTATAALFSSSNAGGVISRRSAFLDVCATVGPPPVRPIRPNIDRRTTILQKLGGALLWLIRGWAKLEPSQVTTWRCQCSAANSDGPASTSRSSDSGVMRLPVIDGRPDRIDYGADPRSPLRHRAWLNYVDTAYFYHATKMARRARASRSSGTLSPAGGVTACACHEGFR